MKKRTALLMLLVLLINLSACEGATNSRENTSSLPSDISSDAMAQMRIVVDMAGRSVHVPKKVESAAVIYGVPINFLLALGVADRLIAVNATWSIYDQVEPNLARTDTVGQGAVDLEKLAKLKPDVFIHRANEPKAVEAVEALGIPVIVVQPETTQQILDTLLVLGEVFDVEQRAAELVSYYDSKTQLARSIVANIPLEERKTVIMMGSELGKVAGGDMLQSDMIETAGGINLAKDVRTQQTWPMVGAEAIFEWNPDFIFCTNSKSSNYTPEELLADPVWAELKAIKSDSILKMPSKVDSWEFPGVVTCLGFLWMLHQMYPNYYDEERFLMEVDAFYQMAYGMTFEREYLGGY